MTVAVINYRNRRFDLDDYRMKTILEDNREVRYMFATYKGREFKAKDLPALRGLLAVVFDAELREGGIK
jgi:hypothetical protein